MAVARSGSGEGERARGRLRARAATERRRAPVSRRRGLELILTEDPTRAAQIAEELDRANHERRQVERRIRFEAEAQMAELGERAAYVLAGEGWHPGVIGIVASRLVERSGRPVVMIALDGRGGQGLGPQHRALRPARGADARARAACCATAAIARPRACEIERARVERLRARSVRARRARAAAEDLVAGRARGRDRGRR